MENLMQLNGNFILDDQSIAKANFKKSDELVALIKNDYEICIKRKQDVCSICGSDKHLTNMHQSKICSTCKEALSTYSIISGSS